MEGVDAIAAVLHEVVHGRVCVGGDGDLVSLVPDLHPDQSDVDVEWAVQLMKENNNKLTIST